jgi:hypothetical protein
VGGGTRARPASRRFPSEHGAQNMHPPEYVCKKLYEMHPNLRLAWLGMPRENEDDLNAGNFCIVQLYHIRDAGPPDEPRTFFQHWNDCGFSPGPVFNKYGAENPDWDLLSRVPILAWNLEQMKISTYDVFGTGLLYFIKNALDYRKMKLHSQRVQKERESKDREMKNHTEAMIDEAADFLWHEANKTGATSIDVPYEFAKKDVEDMKRKTQLASDYLDTYNQKRIPRF